MFNAYPPSDDALWFLEYVLFGFWWHPVQWFGCVLAVSIVIWICASTVRMAFYLVWRAALILAVLLLPASAASSTGKQLYRQNADARQDSTVWGSIPA